MLILHPRRDIQTIASEIVFPKTPGWVVKWANIVRWNIFILHRAGMKIFGRKVKKAIKVIKVEKPPSKIRKADVSSVRASSYLGIRCD